MPPKKKVTPTSAGEAAAAVSSSSADPRKLAPIYEAMDARLVTLHDNHRCPFFVLIAPLGMECALNSNFRGALKLIDAALGKSGALQSLMVLKALCLQRMGRRDEALGAASLVQQAAPTDAAILNTLLMVYKEADAGMYQYISYPIVAKQ
jgi:hypothetical protein